MKNYIIEAGDTISAIAKANGISQKKLLAANQSISDANDIKVGDQLSIPEKVEDPATQDALSQSNSKTDGAVEECPLQAEWLTIKPLRYAVADEDSEAVLPDDFKINSDLPTLKQHKYIVRELIEQYVYLYHPKEHYLLEVHYQNAKVPYQAGQVTGRCVFGELDQTDPEKNVSTALAKSPALLKQKKGDNVVMWLTHAPLTDSRAKLLQENPKLTRTLGQSINLVAAAKDKQDSSFPLFKSKNIIGELLAKQEEQMTWTALPLVSGVEENSLSGNHNKETPDNSFGVSLIDSIGIVTDLCREFSVGYEVVMNTLIPAQHPFYMAKLTRALIKREAVKNRDTVDVYDEEKVRKQYLDTKIDLPMARSQFGSVAAKKKAENAFIEENLKRRLASAEKNINKTRQDLYDERKAELEEHIHVKEMDRYLVDNKDGSKEANKEIKKALDDLAEDWLTWLQHDQLDIALGWFDDSDNDQYALKEALVAASLNNINATDKGAQLAKNWTTKIMNQVSSEEGEIKADGMSGHIMSALGYDWSGAIMTTATLAKLSNDVIDALRDIIKNARSNALKEAARAMTVYSDIIIDVIQPHMINMGAMTPSAAKLWNTTIDTLQWREGINLPLTKVGLASVADDIMASNAGILAVASGHKLAGQTQYNWPSSMASTTIELFDLEEGKGASGFKRFFAKYMRSAEVYISDVRFTAAYKASDKLFTAATSKSALGVFGLAQAYNAMQIHGKMEQLTGDDRDKAKMDLYAALINVYSTSVALIDKFASKAFGGATLSAYIGGIPGKEVGKGAMAVGNTTGKGLSKIASPIAKALRSNPKTAIRYADFFGKATGRIVGFSFRFIPVMGALFSTVSSRYQYNKDKGEQTKDVVLLSGLSLVLNGFALALTFAGVFSANPILIGLGLVLGLVSLVIDGIRGMVADSQLEVILKRSFWGKESYKYAEGLNTIEDKLAFFSNAGNKEDDDTKKSNIGKAMQKELRAFCDFLYKPVVEVIEQTKDANNFSKFVLQIYLPGFIPKRSNFTFTLTGKKGGGDVQLATNSAKNRWLKNQLEGKMVNEGTIQLTVDERLLEAQPITMYGHTVDVGNRKGMNYYTYNMALQYHNPSGIPITLDYPKITIDDANFSILLWRHNTEVEDYVVEQTTYE
ncbi:MAG: LysM peptidoglycan-binding domain-containing protein [Marinomonas sp.]|uniref:LysM peptidoglycan-binding domain-containing protein n=1 Tax=Marinomonas sp. TaxID=1904862 RepID=UPI003F9702A0